MWKRWQYVGEGQYGGEEQYEGDGTRGKWRHYVEDVSSMGER